MTRLRSTLDSIVPLIVALVALASGCGSAGPPHPERTPRTEAAGARAATVAIDHFAFEPAQLVIAPGTTVTWTNHDDVPHSATGDAGQFDSDLLDTSEEFAHTFDRSGTYHYYCKLHPHMTGEVVVRPEEESR